MPHIVEGVLVLICVHPYHPPILTTLPWPPQTRTRRRTRQHSQTLRTRGSSRGPSCHTTSTVSTSWNGYGVLPAVLCCPPTRLQLCELFRPLWPSTQYSAWRSRGDGTVVWDALTYFWGKQGKYTHRRHCRHAPPDVKLTSTLEPYPDWHRLLCVLSLCRILCNLMSKSSLLVRAHMIVQCQRSGTSVN